jgi:PAS domain S-box-containing protein
MGARSFLPDLAAQERGTVIAQKFARAPLSSMNNLHRAALHPTEERFRLLVESVQDYAIFMLDPDGCVATWNSGAQRINGFSAREIIGHNFSQFYTEEDRKAGKPRWELDCARVQGRIEQEGWRLRKGGARFWAFAVVTAMRDAKGKLIGFANVMRDLTERNATEAKLRASEEQFRMLVDGVDEYAIYLLDPVGNIVTWNSGAQQMKGYTASEIIGKNFACFYTPEDVANGKPQYNLQEARHHGHTRAEGLRVRKDGTTFHAEVVLTALRDVDGNLRGFSKVTRDITDHIRTREAEAAKIAAEKSSKAKDDFLAALSHELRTPLTPALAAASYLVDNVEKLPSEFSAELDVIRRNVQLEARLIDDLLDLTRVTRGKVSLQFQRVDAHVCVREALAIARAGITEKELHVSTELEAEKQHICADPVRLEQVFWNLINNAVKFTDHGGKIEIRTSNDANGRFEFEISDNGIGIDLAQRETLFQPFEQGEHSNARQFGGLGLGLAISKHLIDLHSGAITVESQGRNHGATFRVTLETVSDQMSDQSSTEIPALPSKSLRILLVEDHNDTRQTLSRLLSHFGHDISVAASTQSAKEIVDTKEFDVVLSDIGLPDGSGYEVITHAKQKQPVKGVALTGFGMDEDIRRSKEAGFDFHLTKPVDFAELRTVLGQLS